MTHDDSSRDLTLDSRSIPPPQRNLPSGIGGYRILGILGEGGMGIVYEAEQPSPRRRVALKVVRGTELVDELRLKMFEREAATLGRLDHRNIASIYESGRTPEGRHFFAMELVRGPSLATWLAGRTAAPDRAELELRLHLFRQICDAVHYAHQRGVIHRDLKPSNVIVTEAPQSGTGSGALSSMAKILDFGLARITEEDVAATQITEVGAIKGTLAYMAPEQARGEVAAIDVRTDVYALGVLLYELLTRERPYNVDTGSLLSAVGVICEHPPRPLSAVWKSTTRLDPDLATIVATAREEEPDRRYASAAAFAEDVGRFLESEPILARPASTMYQLSKLVARQKPLFATAAAALVLLVAAAVGVSILYVRSEANLARALEAEQAARREAETAERTSTFLVDLFDRANPERSRGATVTAREVMDEGARRIAGDLAGEPVMQARLLYTIGQVYLSLGLYDDARRLIEQSLALRREHVPAGDLDIAASTHQLARVLEAQGDPKAARAAFDEAAGLYERNGAKGTDGLIDLLGNLGWMLGQNGDFAAANEMLDRAMALAEAKQPPDEERILDLLNNRSTTLMDEGAPDSALVVLDRALALSRRLHGDGDRDMASILTNMGVAHSMAGRFDEAARKSLAALGIYQSLHGDAHPLVAKEMANLGISLAQQGRRDEARPYLEGALEALERIHGPEHPAVAQGWMNLGLLELESGNARKAIVHLQRAAEVHERATGLETPSLSTSLYHLATARGAVGEIAEARRLLLRVITIDEKIFGPASGEVADDLEALSSLQREAGDGAEADRTEARMRAIREKLAGAGS
ncbi:MAG: tetratricopeptide repeat protein [Candidatus Eiseniibacteriota bacterium]